MPIRKWGLVSLSHYYVGPSSQDGQVKQVIALDRLSLSQPFGEIVGLIGGKGAGKQTLMKILVGEIMPTEGLVSGGPDTSGCLEFPEQGSKELTGEGYAQRKLRKWQVSKKKIPELLEEIRGFSELGSRFSKKMKYYSLEEKIQLEVSILPHVAPSLIYIDESLLAVKEHFYIKVFFYLLKLKELGSSIWIKTENIKRIEGYCDKLLWLEFGRLQKHGEVKDVLRSYDHYYQQIDGLSYQEQKLFWEQGYHAQLLETKAEGKEQESLKLANAGKERSEKKQSLDSVHEEVITRAVSKRRKKQETKPKKIKWLITTGGIVMILGISAFFAIRTPIVKDSLKTLPITKMDPEINNQTARNQPVSTTKQHAVASGETLYGIAKQYGVDVMEIQRINSLQTEQLDPGQLLIIP